MSGGQRKCVVVTGGSGLVGMAMQEVVREDALDKGSEYVFLSSKVCTRHSEFGRD